MTDSSIRHDTFTIERSYTSSPAKVFDAWADPAKKRKWFVEGEGWTIHSFEMDFREGGFERSRFRPNDGPEMTNDAVYHDIVAERRIVCSYGMTMAGKRFSVSLSTLTFEPRGSGTLLRYTEQATFFDGMDGVDSRRGGCSALLEALAEHLGEPA